MMSDYKQMKTGVPQGVVVSPVLLKVIINNLSELKKINGIKTSLYADNLVVWMLLLKNKHDQLLTKMDEAIIVLQNWSKEDMMTAQKKKTFYEVFFLASRILHMIYE